MILRLSLAVICCFCLLWAPIASAQSSSLDDLTAIVSTEDVYAVDVDMTVSFSIPQSGLSLDFSDYIQINLPHYLDVSGSPVVVGDYTGTPTTSIDGNTIKITDIFVLPGKQITIQNLKVDNPGDVDLYQVIVSLTTDEEGSVIKNTKSTLAVINPGTVTMTATITTPQANIQISGFTGPDTFVTFTDGGNVIGTDMSSPVGYFSKLFVALEPDTYNYNLYGVDEDNRATSIVPLTIAAPAYVTTTVSNVLLSPTLEISATELTQGEDLHATGSAYPNTTVTVFTDTPLRTYTATASATGDWTTTIDDTASYNPGDYRLYSLAQTTGGLQSLASQTKLFTITSSSGGVSGSACGDISQGDLNCDTNINLTDFSILMYYWGQADATADINSDGVVNLTDFSILMYYWGN